MYNKFSIQVERLCPHGIAQGYNWEEIGQYEGSEAGARNALAAANVSYSRKELDTAGKGLRIVAKGESASSRGEGSGCTGPEGMGPWRIVGGRPDMILWEPNGSWESNSQPKWALEEKDKLKAELKALKAKLAQK